MIYKRKYSTVDPLGIVLQIKNVCRYVPALKMVKLNRNVMKSKILKIINIDGIETPIKDESHFIEFMSGIFDENEAETEPEDQLIKPITFEGFEAYLNRYCGNLEIVTQ